MAKIHVLSTQTANLIAAGEVVERPANAVKELLENAIDAGATEIATEIKNGGIDWISVSDNGSGIAKEDLPLAIRRHATSKIQTESDLASIATLGFRGEALAAISAASRFSILSKTPDATFGTQMTVEDEKDVTLEECGCADGTTVIVRDLFYNQPARRKFLKRGATEASAILQYMQRIAVSHPEIAFKLISDGAVKLQTAGNGKLDDCIYSVYGKEFAGTITPLYKTSAPYRLSGFITRPEFARNNHSYQSFYINGRYVKSRTMQFAMEDAYKSFVKSEKFPGCVIFLTIDFEKVDVNVHPAKLEVRFEDERSVYQAIYYAVRKTLENLSNRLAKEEYQKEVSRAQGTHSAVKPIREAQSYQPVTAPPEPAPDRKERFELPIFATAKVKETKPLPPAEEAPLPKKQVIFGGLDWLTSDRGAKAKISVAKPEAPKDAPPEEAPQEEQLVIPEASEPKKEDNPITLPGRIVGVLFDAFILYESGDAVYVIDKHAAHERILYEGLKKTHSADSVQYFLEPVIVNFNPLAAAALSEHLEELNRAGFALEEFGADSFALRSVPLVFSSLSAEALSDMLQKTALELQLGGKAQGVRDKAFDRVLYSMACKAAVKAGIPSMESEHEWIVQKLREIDHILVCPHGRPVLVRFSKKHMENLFLRT